MRHGINWTSLSIVPSLWTLVAIVAATFGHSPVSAQNASKEGLLITVPSPITSEAYESIKLKVETARKSQTRQPSKIVFDFNPGGKDASTSRIGEAGNLAKFISTISDIQTIAYVHGKVTGHTVLPVLVCQELVMSTNSKIGEIVQPGETLDPNEANTYEFYIASRRKAQMAAVRKMYDPQIELLTGKDKAGGIFLVSSADRAKAEKEGITISDPRPIMYAPRGRVGLYDTTQAMDLGLCQARVENRNELAEKYGLNPASLKDDMSVDRPPLGFKYVLNKPITRGVSESVVRSLNDVVRKRGTIVFLQIEFGGGDINAARDLAAELQKFEQAGDDAIKIVAFIPDSAPDCATIVALGCSDIVMSRRNDLQGAGKEKPTESTIGDFSAVLKKSGDAILEQSLVKLAEEQGYPPLLIKGMLDPSLKILRVQKIVDPSVKSLMTQEELDADKATWRQERVVKQKDEILKLSATEAEQLGLARFVVENRDISEVISKYGMDPGKVREITPGALDQFAAFLRIPAVTVLLVLIGFTGLVLELKVPGTTVPGIVAALCAILFFWAHTQFSGQVAVLAGSFFVLGLVLILLEVFVLPGFGAPGIIGILFVLTGLALATMDSIPHSSGEWVSFGMRVTQFLLIMVFAVALAFFIGYFLPQIPYLNKMMLIPAADRTDPVTELKESVAGAAQAMALIGAVGTTVTVLRPAGNVRFGDQFVDVVADGGYIPAGVRVKVVLVEGNRIVVKEV